MLVDQRARLESLQGGGQLVLDDMEAAALAEAVVAVDSYPLVRRISATMAGTTL